jgi:hypothetical protein
MSTTTLNALLFIGGMLLAGGAATGFFMFAATIGLRPAKHTHRPRPLDAPAMRHARAKQDVSSVTLPKAA